MTIVRYIKTIATEIGLRGQTVFQLSHHVAFGMMTMKYMKTCIVHSQKETIKSRSSNLMDAVLQKEWLQSENHDFLFELMRDEE